MYQEEILKEEDLGKYNVENRYFEVPPGVKISVHIQIYVPCECLKILITPVFCNKLFLPQANRNCRNVLQKDFQESTSKASVIA